MFTIAEALMFAMIATQQLRAHVNNFILLSSYMSRYIRWWYFLPDEYSFLTQPITNGFPIENKNMDDNYICTFTLESHLSHNGSCHAPSKAMITCTM